MSKKSDCLWYEVCPIKEFSEEGVISENWVSEYCWGDNSKCVRAQKEEQGKYVPDNMMPDGTRDKSLE